MAVQKVVNILDSDGPQLRMDGWALQQGLQPLEVNLQRGQTAENQALLVQRVIGHPDRSVREHGLKALQNHAQFAGTKIQRHPAGEQAALGQTLAALAEVIDGVEGAAAARSGED